LQSKRDAIVSKRRGGGQRGSRMRLRGQRRSKRWRNRSRMRLRGERRGEEGKKRGRERRKVTVTN